MKFSAAALALSAIPALALEFPKERDHKDFQIEQVLEIIGQHSDEHGHEIELPPRPEWPYPEHTHELTVKIVCERLHHFARQADYLYSIVRLIRCGKEFNHCWEPIWRGLYELEFSLDWFDTLIDESDLNKCWNCDEEREIACCYKTYAESLIRLLDLIARKTEYLDGETDKYIVTAVNSLKAADYTFVYELVRRMHCEEFEKQIMRKEGATDGSTRGSIRAAFAEFVATPYITGEDFRECRHGCHPGCKHHGHHHICEPGHHCGCEHGHHGCKHHHGHHECHPGCKHHHGQHHICESGHHCGCEHGHHGCEHDEHSRIAIKVSDSEHRE